MQIWIGVAACLLGNVYHERWVGEDKEERRSVRPNLNLAQKTKDSWVMEMYIKDLCALSLFAGSCNHHTLNTFAHIQYQCDK